MINLQNVNFIEFSRCFENLIKKSTSLYIFLDSNNLYLYKYFITYMLIFNNLF
jgi:hypothetical protein